MKYSVLSPTVTLWEHSVAKLFTVIQKLGLIKSKVTWGKIYSLVEKFYA